MSNKEYGSLTKHGKFRTKPGAMADKWMSTTYDDAVTWGTKFHGEGNFRIVKIKVPTSSLSKMYHVPMLDNIGPAYSAHYNYLNEIMLGFGRVL